MSLQQSVPKTVDPYQVYTRVIGTHGTLAGFFHANNVQESVGQDGADINVDCYHSKIYAIDGPITMHLSVGQQIGQIKKVTMVHKGTDTANILVLCPTLNGDAFQILFSNVGDQLELIWTGFSWSVLTTLNVVDPFQQTPWVS